MCVYVCVQQLELPWQNWQLLCTGVNAVVFETPQEALADLSQAKALDPWHNQIPLMNARLRHAQQQSLHTADRILAAKMLRQ
jgi:hypothetical protein